MKLQINLFRRNKQNQAERGQSLPELALSLVLLLMLLLGAYDFGRAFYTWIALRDAAQEGAAYGSQSGCLCNPAVIARARETSSGTSVLIGGLPDNIGVSCVLLNGCASGETIQVTTTYTNFVITTPFLASFLGSQSIPIRATIKDTILVPGCPYP